VDQDLPNPGGNAPAGLRHLLRGERIGPGYRAGGQDGCGPLRSLLALRQPEGVRGGPPRGAQERLLGDVR
jgi:hypothetical protein